MSTQVKNYKGAILITGAAGGIGVACIRKLDEEGYLILAGVRTPESGEYLKSKVSNNVIPVLLNITSEESIQAAAENVSQILKSRNIPGLSGLINNAGIIVDGPLELVPIATLRKQFEVNVIGQVAVTQAFLPLLRTGKGRIINIGAVTGRITIPFMGLISSSKTALESITDAMRVEFGLWNIPVSIIELSGMKTDIFKKADSEFESTLKDIPVNLKGKYNQIFQAINKSNENQTLDDPQIAAKAIYNTLTAKHPKTRYLVGKGARLFAFLGNLPDKLRDKLLLGALGITKDMVR